MTEASVDQPLPKDAWWRSAMLPVAVVLLVGIAAGAAIVLSSSVSGDDTPPPPPAFTAPPASPLLVYDVKQRAGDTLDLTPDPKSTLAARTLTLTPAIRIEFLEPIEVADVSPGDFVTVYGIPNEYKNFAIHFVVVAAPSLATSGKGFFLSKGGFNGAETTRIPEDRPILGGAVDRVEGKAISATSGGASVKVVVEPTHRLFRLREGVASEIKDGDRLVGDFSADPPAALLVRPSGTD
ncbi:MAG: hypothetical protein ACKVVT_10370 [Dehalococcoidia bacterium]